MKTIKDIPISGKRVLIRVDFNVPLDDQQRILDDARIKAVLPTIQYALNQSARVILASHLGRPKGQVRMEFSLEPVAKRLSQILGKAVRLAPDCVGAETRAFTNDLPDGSVLLLENLRFHAEEQQNDAEFAQALAGLCDVYINDAFGVSHRANASVEAVTSFAPNVAAGLLLKKELDFLRQPCKIR